MPYLESGPRYESPWCFTSDHSSKIVLLRELDNHLGGTGRVFVDKNYDSSMKALASEAFGFENNGFLSKEFDG